MKTCAYCNSPICLRCETTRDVVYGYGRTPTYVVTSIYCCRCGGYMSNWRWEPISDDKSYKIEGDENMCYDSNNKPDLSTLEKANEIVQKLNEIEMAYLYKALYLNDMRIDKAENAIYKSKGKKE